MPPNVPAQGQRIAVVTGASSGIGLATAALFCKHGIAVIACGRRAARLEELQAHASEDAPVLPLVFDATQWNQVRDAFASLPEAWRGINILVNNAGNAHGSGPIDEGDPSDWDAMIDINLRGLLYVSRSVLPLMPKGPDSNSIVVNVGSIVGRDPYPGGAVYAATKAAVDNLTRGMRLDLYQRGVKVASMHPGMVLTEFSLVRFKGKQDAVDELYRGIRTLTAEDCADALYYMVTRPAHVNVADLTLAPTDQAGVRDVVRRPAADAKEG